MKKITTTNRLAKIAIAGIMMSLMLSTITNIRPAAAVNNSTASVRIAALGGQEARDLAALIGHQLGEGPSAQIADISLAKVVVASGLPASGSQVSNDSRVSNDEAQVINAFYSGATVVTIGNTVSSTTTKPTTQSVTPSHLISVARIIGQAVVLRDFTILKDSTAQYQDLAQEASLAVSSLLTTSPLALTSSALASSPNVASNDITGPWTLKFSMDNTLLYGSNGDQLYTRYEIAQLNYWDGLTYREYWRTDTAVDHLIKDHQCSYLSAICGPYMNTRTVTVQANIPGAGSNNLGIYLYGPNTTSMDVGVSYTISFGVDSNGVNVGVQYTQSWTNPGVRYDVQADQINSKMTTTETFRGASYGPLWGWPITDATPNSYNSYRTIDSVIMRTPVTNGFSPTTLHTNWNIENDVLLPIPSFPWPTLLVTRTYTNFDQSFSPGTLPSMFGTTITINSCPTTDYYGRSHGIAIDRPLPVPWWPPYQSGYEFYVSPYGGGCIPPYTTHVLFSPGSHYVKYAASGSVPSYAWHAKIYINGALTAEGDVGRNQLLTASFTV